MIRIPTKLLCHTCYLLKNGSKDKIKLINVRIDNNFIGMRESTSELSTKAGKWVLHYDCQNSSGLPEGTNFSVGDTILSDVYPIGNSTINFIEPAIGKDGQINFYEVILN